jgi:hypothetical protein
MIMGFFLVRPIPLPVQDNSDIEEGRDQHRDYLEAISSALDPHGSRTPLLDHDDFAGGMQGSHSALIRTGIKSARIDEEYALEDIPFRSPNGVSTVTSLSSQSRSPNREVTIPKINLHGRQLWTNSDFWLLFTILAIRKSFFPRFCHSRACFIPFFLQSAERAWRVRRFKRRS